MGSNTERAAENISNPLPDYKKLPPQTDGPVIRTAFVTTDTIRFKIETIERVRELAGLSSSWDDVILKLLDCYYTNK
jgi:hypothetical protein